MDHFDKWDYIPYLTCAPGRIRTCDTGFRRAVLYPLSYEGVTRSELTETFRYARTVRPGRCVPLPALSPDNGPVPSGRRP